MPRYRDGWIFAVFFTTCLFASAQTPLPISPTYDEPPVAESRETKPAPSSTIVVPGQPRMLPPLDIPGNPYGTGMPGKFDPATGIQPVQYITPSTPPTSPPGAPTVLHAEPPTPTVKITVKGIDTAPSGQELTYRLTVTNSSEARAHNVIARCAVPRGAKLIKALPQPNNEGKDLEWHLETIEPGGSRQIEVVFKPAEDAVEIAVVGKVQFEHGRFIKTKIVNPMLEMKKLAPAQGILHDAMTYKIVVNNPGKVAVTDIQVVDTLPEGLEYVQETPNGAMPVARVGPAPNQRTWTLGVLKPGETRTIEYRVMPRKLGEWLSDAVATGSGVQTKAGCNTAIQDAKITLQVTGPTQDKGTANQATPYLIFVHNTGTATLHNVRILCAFPVEMRLAKVSNGGHLFKDGAQWTLPKLAPQETKELSVSLTAPSAGLREVVVSARADHGLEQKKKVQTVFAGIPALNWQTEGTAVASIGQEITYTITVKNPGSAPTKNVKIVVDLPEQVDFRQAQPGFQRGQGAVFFNALEIAPKQEMKLKIIAVAKKAGEARFHFEMSAEGMSSGPLKNSRATTISPGGEGPKDADPSRVGSLPAKEEKKTDPAITLPTNLINPVEPSYRPAHGTDR